MQSKKSLVLSVDKVTLVSKFAAVRVLHFHLAIVEDDPTLHAGARVKNRHLVEI